MAKGDPDPRDDPAPVEDVPGLVAEGAREFNAGRYWHAHEAWEEAWHALRKADDVAAADFVQGMILVTAGFENAKRGKENGFKRQTAKGITMMRANRAHARVVGVEGADAWVDAVTDAYLQAMAHLKFEWWTQQGVAAPRVSVRDPG